MPKGSCVCGEYTYELTGKPAGVAICHCIPCKKTAGCNGSYNYLMPEEQLKHLSGKAVTSTRKGDSGKNLTYQYCGNCYTMISCLLESMPGTLILKAGTLDDKAYEEENGKPQQEIYIKNRPSWCGEWKGVEHHEVS